MLFSKVLAALSPLLVTAHVITAGKDSELSVRAPGDKYTFTGTGSNVLYTLTVVSQCTTNANFPPDLFANAGATLGRYVDSHTKDSGTLQVVSTQFISFLGLYYQTAPSWYLGSFFPGDIDDTVASLQTMIGQLGSPRWVQISLEKGSDIVGTFWYGFRSGGSRSLDEVKRDTSEVTHVDGFPSGSAFGC